MRDDMRVKLVIVVFVVSCSSIITRLASAAVQNEECRVGRCGDVEIRFPFHLKVDDEDEDDKCVFPAGFLLTCVNVNTINYVRKVDNGHRLSTPMVEFEYLVNTSIPGIYLSLSVQASVYSIDYMSRQLWFISDKQHITQQQYDFSHNSTSTSPFTASTLSHSEFYDQSTDDQSPADYTFYNCSASINNYYKDTVHSLSNNQYRVVFLYTDFDIAEASLRLCKKMYTISDVPYTEGFLTWSGPDCTECETNKQYCKFKPNSTTTVTECYGQRPADKLLLAGKIGGICLMVLTLVALCYALKSYKQMKKHQSKIEMFLADYKALKPSRYSYADIKKITNQFKVKLGEGGFGSVFKGQLSNDIVVAVKVLNDRVDAKGSGEDFVNEVGTIGLIHHVNVVRLVGYCADGCNRALVYEFLPNNSLDKYAYSRNKQNKNFLGWEKMKDIAIGIAKGIEYLHQDCSQQILHFDIKPNNILLDQNFNPKIADFGLAKLCTKGESMVSMTMARGTIGYIAPEVFSRNFGKVSSKSDVYSFGMLLLEMVGAKDHTLEGTENMSEVYFPEWVFHQLERGKETRIEIEEGVDNNIARKLTIVGLWCINWHPADRPSMKRVIQMLQEEECPAIPPNPFNSATSRNATAFGNNLEVINE